MFRNRTTSWKKDIIIGKIGNSDAAGLKGVKSAAGLFEGVGDTAELYRGRIMQSRYNKASERAFYARAMELARESLVGGERRNRPGGIPMRRCGVCLN